MTVPLEERTFTVLGYMRTIITTDHWVIKGMIRDIPGQFRIKLSLRYTSRRGVTPAKGLENKAFSREAAGRGCFTPNMGYDYREGVRTDIHRMLRYRRCDDVFISGPHGHAPGPR